MRSVYFSEKELECPCCGKCDMDPLFLSMLDNLRTEMGMPLYLNSAFRCKAQNDLVKGVLSSAHLLGKAADIRVSNGSMRRLIIRAADRVGFRRIGISKGFVHVDTDTYLPQDVWWTY